MKILKFFVFISRLILIALGLVYAYIVSCKTNLYIAWIVNNPNLGAKIDTYTRMNAVIRSLLLVILWRLIWNILSKISKAIARKERNKNNEKQNV